MVIIETAIFTKIITTLISDDEYRALQEVLVGRPGAGTIIKHSGGLRKVRWSLEGRGKSSGVRIIYYWKAEDEQIYMVYAFSKNTQENLTGAQLKVLRNIVDKW